MRPSIIRNKPLKIGDRVIADCLFGGGIRIGTIIRVVDPGEGIETEIEIKDDRGQPFQAKLSSAKFITSDEEERHWLYKFADA